MERSQCLHSGEGHNLQEHSIVLVRGGRVKDFQVYDITLFAVRLDTAGVEGRTQRRSNMVRKDLKK